MQIFPRQLNALPLVLAVVAVGGGVATWFLLWYFFTPEATQVGYRPKQPVPYSHKLHVGELGLDCRYCHANVERSQEAMVPPTQTCMGCHAQVRKDSPRLEAVRRSWESGRPVPWVRVHKLPEHVYFDHSAHLAAGVGCVSCHGRVDQMDVAQVAEPISMEWCLRCHRDPAPSLRPKDQITNMAWEPTEEWVADASQVNPPQHCSGCHR